MQRHNQTMLGASSAENTVGGQSVIPLPQNASSLSDACYDPFCFVLKGSKVFGQAESTSDESRASEKKLCMPVGLTARLSTTRCVGSVYRYSGVPNLPNVSGIGVGAVPNLPKCRAPVLRLYRTLPKKSVRYLAKKYHTLDNSLLNMPIQRTMAYCTNFSEPFGERNMYRSTCSPSYCRLQ